MNDTPVIKNESFRTSRTHNYGVDGICHVSVGSCPKVEFREKLRSSATAIESGLPSVWSGMIGRYALATVQSGLDGLRRTMVSYVFQCSGYVWRVNVAW
jgi:hypothetical protein